MIIKHAKGIKNIAALEAFVNEKVKNAGFRVATTNEKESVFQIGQDALRNEIVAAIA